MLWQPIKFRDLDKSTWIVEDNSRNIYVEKILNICSETAKIATFHFSRYQSMETISCHSNQSSYPIGTKNTIIRSPHLQMLYVKYGKNRLLTASDEKSFENVDGRPDRRTGRRIPAYRISSPMSLGLRWAKNSSALSCFTYFFMILYMYIALGQGQEQSTHWGQKFDVNRKASSSWSSVASFKKISSTSEFIHIFSWFNKCTAYSRRSRTDNPQGTKFWCQQKPLVTSVIWDQDHLSKLSSSHRSSLWNLTFIGPVVSEEKIFKEC